MKRSLRAAGICLIAALVTAPVRSQSYTFQVFAGSGGGAGTVDGIGDAVRFYWPSSVAIDSDGNVYVTDGNRVIRKVAPNSLTTTLAGTAGMAGFANGRRADARFFSPSDLSIDGARNIYVSDRSNNAIRKITPGGTVTTIADGSDGLNRPDGVFVDGSGNVIFADSGSHTIRQVTPAGVVTTIAGTGVPGHVNGPAFLAQFNSPTGVVADSAGALYIVDGGNYVIRKISGGMVTTLAGTPGEFGYTDGPPGTGKFANVRGIAIDGSGNVIATDGRIRVIAADGMITTIPTDFWPNDVTLDRRNGNLYFADLVQHVIRKMTTSGQFSLVAGHLVNQGSIDGTGTAALFSWPADVVSDSAGTIYAVEMTGNKIRRITPDGVTSTLAGSGDYGWADGSGTQARFAAPNGIAVDASFNVYVADTGNNVIRKITPQGQVTTIAGLHGTPGSSDGQGTDARFNNPYDVTCDAAGNLYVADTFNNTIRKIAPGGWVSTLAGSAGQPGFVDDSGSAARFRAPRSLVVDALGSIDVVDENHAVRRVTAAGVVTTLAGSGNGGSQDGTGSAARFNYPHGIASDAAGNLFVADSNNATIRKVTQAGVVTTIGGIAWVYGAVDGTGDTARFVDPSGTAVDPLGRIYVADAHADTIRRGTVALSDRATIDNASGETQVPYQLGTSPSTATTWHWSIIRRPAGSMAELSNSSIRNPTFTPDAADLYVFSLTASDGTSTSISEVSLTAVCPTVAIAPTTLPAAARGESYSTNITARHGLRPHWFEQVSGTIPDGLVLTSGGTLSGVVSVSAGTGDYVFRIRAGDQCDCSAEADISLRVSPLPAPTGLVATALSSTTVQLSWDRYASATSYGVYRRSTWASGFTLVGAALQPPSGNPSFIDAVTPDTAYLYVVDAFVGTTISGASRPDLATSVIFTDPTLTPYATTIKAAHVAELRTAVTAIRTLAALPLGTFTDPTLTSAGVKSVHFIELRGSLTAARTVLGLTPLTYTDPTITPGSTPIKAAHVNELRAGVQ